MVAFLTRKQTAFQVEEVIKTAEEEVVLISPYLQLSDDLVARLKDADKQGVDIKIIYRNRADEELKPNQTKKLEDEIKRLQPLKNLSLARLINLHAKCYYNENCMVITSMNLYDYSEKNNWEMGLLIHREHDAQVFEEAKVEAEAIFKNAEPIKARSSLLGHFLKGVSKAVNSMVQDEPGHCIGCGKDMTPYDKDHPICRDCWKRGVRQGRFCYRCGEKHERRITQKRPLCATCYGQSEGGS